jgi:hypothetical protein
MKEKLRPIHFSSDTRCAGRANRRLGPCDRTRPDCGGTRYRRIKPRDLEIVLNGSAQGRRQERYAETVIDDPDRFDAIEVHDICEFVGQDGEIYSESDCDQLPPDSYSVFAHLTEGGIDCCGDFSRREDALNYAKEMADSHGWNLYDFTGSASRNVTSKDRQRTLVEMAEAIRAGYYEAIRHLDTNKVADVSLAEFIHTLYIEGLAAIWERLNILEG